MSSGGFSNHLDQAEVEALAITAEEMGEAILEIGKILRHGIDSSNPLMPNSPTNRQKLECELGHIMCAITILCDLGLVSQNKIEDGAEEKRKAISRWLHHFSVELDGVTRNNQ